MDRSIARRIEALEETWASLRTVLGELDAGQWHLPTGCPGWDVQDVVSHISGIERLSRGEPPPDHSLPPDLPHVRNDVGRATELAVDYRRAWPHEQVFEEFCEVTSERSAELRSDPSGPDDPKMGPFGVMPYRSVLTLRIFDSFAHEQDIRRAIGRPGNLTGSAALTVRRQILSVWAGVVQQLPQLSRTRVLLELDGQTESLSGEATEENTRAEGELVLQTTFENAIALGCGRADADPSTVIVVGDAALFGAMVPLLGFTP